MEFVFRLFIVIIQLVCWIEFKIFTILLWNGGLIEDFALGKVTGRSWEEIYASIVVFLLPFVLLEPFNECEAFKIVAQFSTLKVALFKDFLESWGKTFDGKYCEFRVEIFNKSLNSNFKTQSGCRLNCQKSSIISSLTFKELPKN